MEEIALRVVPKMRKLRLEIMFLLGWGCSYFLNTFYGAVVSFFFFAPAELYTERKYVKFKPLTVALKKTTGKSYARNS